MPEHETILIEKTGERRTRLTLKSQRDTTLANAMLVELAHEVRNQAIVVVAERDPMR